MGTLLTIAATCRMLGVSRATFGRWRRQGLAPPVVRIGMLSQPQLRVRLEDLERWIEARTEGAELPASDPTEAPNVAPPPRRITAREAFGPV